MNPAVAARAMVPPNASSVERMSIIDAMAPAWRALANEYGFEIVNAICRDDQENSNQTSSEEAEDALMVYRETRQIALLSASHKLAKPRGAKAIADATIRRVQARGKAAAGKRLVEVAAVPRVAISLNDLGL